MGKSGYHEGWEILVSDYSRPVLASRLIAEIEKGSDLANGITRHQTAEDNQYYRCAHCRVPVRLAGGNGTQRLHFRHFTKSPEYKQQAEGCPFCHPSSEQRKLYSEVFRGEGPWHLSNKAKVADILSRDPLIDADSVATERYIYSKDHDINIRRQPDIYCRDRKGNHWVFELTRWWLHPETAVARQQAYRQLGYNLVWLFSPDCMEKNRSTFHLLLYGSNYHDGMLPEALAGEGAQFNAFELSEAALMKSDSEGVLHLDVVYPHFVVDESLGSIDITYQQEIMSMHSLSLAPQQRLPYGVKTAVQLQQAKEHLEAARQALARQEEEQRYVLEKDILKDVRRDLGAVRRCLGTPITDDAQVEDCRALIIRCRAKLYDLGVERSSRIGKVIARSEAKVQEASARYFEEKAARLAQLQTLREAALAFVDKVRGRPLAPDSEESKQGRALYKQLFQSELTDLARRVESACHACHRRYIDIYIRSLGEALLKYQTPRWVLESRVRLLSLLHYTETFSERQLQGRLEKLLPIIDNHPVYFDYCRQAAELARPVLSVGLLDKVIAVHDRLIEVGLDEYASNLLFSAQRRYLKQAEYDFSVLSVWDEKMDYRGILPLAIRISYDNPADIAALLGCNEASLLRMPEIRDCYVEQARESVANFFEAIGKVLPQLISEVLLSGNHSMQAHYSQAGEKLFDDCLLYIASFPTVELQDQAQGLVNDIYGHMFDQLCSS